MEKDEIRRHDSFQAFEEICSIAEQKQVIADFSIKPYTLFHFVIGVCLYIKANGPLF